MKNYEKYKDLVIESFKENSPCRLCNTAFRGECIPTTCKEGRERITQWLDEEYAPQIDWSKVPVDTPVIIPNNKKRHFCKYEDNKVFIFADGVTSWSCPIPNSPSWLIDWNPTQVTLAREEDIEKYRIQ